MSKFYKRNLSVTVLVFFALTIFFSRSVYGMEDKFFEAKKTTILALPLIQVTQANLEDPQEKGLQVVKGSIKNLANTCHKNFFSDVLEFLIKENFPTSGFDFCHKNLSSKELEGKIQYRLAYMLLMEALIAPNYKKRKFLKKASKWNQKAALNGNRDAQKLSNMAFVLVPPQQNIDLILQINAEAL